MGSSPPPPSTHPHPTPFLSRVHCLPVCQWPTKHTVNGYKQSFEIVLLLVVSSQVVLFSKFTKILRKRTKANVIGMRAKKAEGVTHDFKKQRV